MNLNAKHGAEGAKGVNEAGDKKTKFKGKISNKYVLRSTNKVQIDDYELKDGAAFSNFMTSTKHEYWNENEGDDHEIEGD